MSRIQVLISEEEREAFRREAERHGLSLSAWLRAAGIDHLEASRLAGKVTTRELRRLFADARKREKVKEPDWEDHLAVMSHSRNGGNVGP